MTAVRDRRDIRRRALRRGGGLAAAGLVASLILLLAGSPLLSVAVLVACLAGVIVLLHRPGGVPVLVYHSVSPDASWLPWSDNTSVRPETLRTHLRTLKRGGWTIISTRSLIAARQSGRALPGRTVVLHFDDCYLDNFLFAAPILREFAASATFFASTDFIEPTDGVRLLSGAQGPAAWSGYMTGPELRMMDADPLFDIEAHGVDHGRVPVSAAVIGTADAENWRRHMPLDWAITPGNKARWYEAANPPAHLAPGAPIPQSDSALAGRWFRNGSTEAEADFSARVGQAISSAHAELGRILTREPVIFAWPFDRSHPAAIAAARAAGFGAVTGGRGENRPDEDPTVLSRVHMQDRAFGGGPLWLEGLALYARASVAEGRYYWSPVSALASRLRRRRFRTAGYGPQS